MIDKKPNLTIIAGVNGAGKSTLTESFIFRSVPIVNPDVIAAENRCSLAKAGKIALMKRQELLENRQSFVIETTLTGSSEIVLMRKAKEQGYKINLAYIGINSIIASVMRVEDRVQKGGHSVPIEDILRRYDRSFNNLPKALNIADRIYLFDNTYKKRKLLYVKNRRHEKQMISPLPKWAELCL